MTGDVDHEAERERWRAAGDVRPITQWNQERRRGLLLVVLATPITLVYAIYWAWLRWLSGEARS